MKYLTINEIKEFAVIHTGQKHILHKGKLCLLMDEVRHTIFGVDRYPNLTQKAALYIRFIVTNHPFLDGNKRVALNCATTFLAYNGCRLQETENTIDEFIDLCVKICKKCITDIDVIAEHIQSWIL